MKTVGIICEYNPFHLGHAHQIAAIRSQLGEDTRIVCLMSGSYVQRGVPAMWDKYHRAEAAISCGADLVLELPITEVLQSAEGFAAGGVRILSALGCVDVLCFGAENAEADFLSLAARMDADETVLRLKEGLEQGLSYAAARARAMEDELGILQKPNNILAFEYCRAILQQKSALQPLVLQRTGDYHAREADAEAPSATAVRSLFPDGPWQQFLPEQAASVLQGACWYDRSFGERAMLARLRGLSDAEWAACAHGGEGLWSKVMKAVRSQPDVEAILQASKSKRYPRTRLQRLLLCAYLGIRAEDLSSPAPYVRILAVSESSRPLIRRAKKQGLVELINPGQTPSNRSYYRLETRAADLYTLFAAPGFPCPSGTEQAARIIFSKS